MKNCCFTGHRHIPAAEQALLRMELDVCVRTLIAEGVQGFYCGGALGFDTIAAQTVLRLKQHFPWIRLYLILPCKAQTDFWTEQDRQQYSFILSHADDIQCLHEQYTPGCMHERNRELVKSADTCVYYCKKEKGGTAYTVAFAAKNNLRLIPLG